MNKRKTADIISIIYSLLSIAFWLSVIISLEDVFMAVSTVIAAAIHESGHILYLYKIKMISGFRGVINGLRIKPSGLLSYRQELLLYACGPIANLLTFILLLPFSLSGNTFCYGLAAVNLLTAISNLLPIKGYDGYGMVRVLITETDVYKKAESALRIVSSATIFSLCILSLYLIDRFDGGYWIFFVFFISMLKDISNGIEKIKDEN